MLSLSARMPLPRHSPHQLTWAHLFLAPLLRPNSSYKRTVPPPGAVCKVCTAAPSCRLPIKIAS